jgi:adenine-specific DNA-methyltransferase
VIKYIGSKRVLVGGIVDSVRKLLPGGGTVVDLFSGTSRVGHALKGEGYRVIANDHNAYAEVLARCYVAADLEEWAQRAERLLSELSRAAPKAGYVTETFCVRSRYFHPKNGERIDAIREEIARLCLEPELEAIALVSLMEAADRVDSTTGLQMAYLKEYAPRAHNELSLRMPKLLTRSKSGKSVAHCLDALDAAKQLEGEVVYLDPPYNQHSYLGNYHIWESLVRWDKPEVYGVACKRVDVRQRRSRFNSRSGCVTAIREILGCLRCRAVVVSFSNEGYVARDEMEAMLRDLWDGQSDVSTVETDYKRYVGAQIGIYNPKGKKVGTVSHLRNKEYLYVARRRS